MVVEAQEVGGKIATLARLQGTPTYTPANLSYQNDAGAMVQNGAQVSTPGQSRRAAHRIQCRLRVRVPPTHMG